MALVLLGLAMAMVVRAQISTTTPVPPLQWIHLSNLLQGTTRPPPLKNAAMGYDETSRSLIIFGGLSETGIAQSQTYLLNLDTLTWTSPTPPANLQRSPPARSSFIYGSDSAASNRHGFLIAGGRGADGRPLSDVWAFDFTNQFWSEVSVSPGGPSPRWGASGGRDIRTPFVQDPVLQGPNNTFYLSGGFDGTTVNSLSDVWKLDVSGTLSSNLPDSVHASWSRVNVGELPALVGQSGTVLGKTIVSFGGCTTQNSSDPTCATQSASAAYTDRQTVLTFAPCPAPRVDSLIIPNLNRFSTAFASQAFLLLGAFDKSQWQDSGGLNRGEVAVLDINTGSWARIVPAGDPSNPAMMVPSPRRGAVAFAHTQSLVGVNRNASSDTLVFGGEDEKGNLLSEMWLLRSFNGFVDPPSQTWSGYGAGQFPTGINADGTDAKVSYLTQCAVSTAPPPGAGKPDGNAPSNDGTEGPQLSNHEYDTAFSHKLLSALSLLLFLPVLLIWSVAPSSLGINSSPFHRSLLAGLILLGVISYGLGIAGLAMSFITLKATSFGSASKHVQTTHGVAGLVFALCLYGLAPLGCSAVTLRQRIIGARATGHESSAGGEKLTSDVASERPDIVSSPLPSTPPSVLDLSPPSSPRRRTQSWDAFNAVRPGSGDWYASNESTPSATPRKGGFEVLNRPRLRKTSETWTSQPSATLHSPGSTRIPPSRALGEIDWLRRRRSLNAVGELDFVLTQAHNAQVASMRSPSAAEALAAMPPQWPKPPIIFIYSMIHISILGLTGVSLAMLWERSPRYLFAIFLAFVVIFYIILFTVGWTQQPTASFASTLLWKFRQPTLPTPSPSTQPLTSITSPYTQQQPSYRPSSLHAADQLFQVGAYGRPLSATTDDLEDDDMDDDTRQRMIEEEMERRDVSIVTVPRRKLRIANLS